MVIRQWKLPEQKPDQIELLERQTGLNPMICGILAARGFDRPEQASLFLDSGAPLEDPLRLADMDRAVARVRQALENGERIAIYGDYDCDGITSTALLTSYFQAVGADVIYYVPSREKEGYGLNTGAIDILKDQRVELIITVDNGISAHNEIEYASGLGVDVVVTDHHTPRETLPQAVAVVNPHRADCPSACKELAGVGVAFKLICALEDADGDELLEYYSDIVALGTIADVVPLTGENRVIVRHGLGRLQDTERPGLRALMEVAGLQGKALSSESVAFGLAPRMNAAGRMGVADDAIELLLTESEDYAAEIAGQLDAQNRLRKKTEEQILKEIDGILCAQPQILKERVLVVHGGGWHHGVVGIVAAKLVERYQKPCVLLSVEDGVARGSGRSVEGFSLVEAIAACGELLEQFGGHAMAAGLTLKEENLAAFTRMLLDFAGERYPAMPLPVLAADWSVAPGQLTVEAMSALSLLEPFGAENEVPLFHLPGLRVEGIYPTSDGKHIRIRLTAGSESFYAVYFGVSAADFPYKPGEAVEMMAKISVGEYNGKAQLSIRVSDVRPAGVPQDDILRDKALYHCYQRGEALPKEDWQYLTPTRDDIGIVYKYIRRAGRFPYGADPLYFRLLSSGIGYGKMLLALDVLEEMGLLHNSQDKPGTYSVVPDAPKADLAQSEILTKLRAEMLVKEIERV